MDLTIRAGVGEALVRARVERARSTGGVRASALPTQPAMPGAHRIYRRLGFARTLERFARPLGRGGEPVPGLRLMAFRLELGTPA